MKQGSKNTKASNIAVLALGAAVMAAFLAYPAFATTASTHSSPMTSAVSAAATPSTPAMTPSPNAMGRIAGFFAAHGFGPHGRAHSSQPATFSNGQKLTLTSTQGTYYVVGTKGKTNGTASGTLTFTVTGKLTAGYILSAGGSFVVNGTTYNVTSGSALMGPGGSGIQGQGTTSSSGSFIVRATARGDFSTTTARVSLDFSNGTTEYAVFLTGSIQG